MRKGFLGSLAVLAAGAGLSFGQSYGPPPGPGGPPPMAAYGPPPGTTPVPPPGAVPGPGPIPSPGPSGPGMYSYTSPDGHPLIMPPGLEGMIPPGSMGAGAPGGVYGGGDGGAHGLLPGLFGGLGKGGIYFGADYLYWVPKSQDLNFPLVTTSAPASAGIPGLTSTVALCGPHDDISYDQVNGFRVWAGIGLNDGGLGCEVGGFWLETAHRNFQFASNSIGEPLLAIPFFDAATGATSSFVIASPGVSTGAIDIEASTRVWSAEASMVYNTGASQDGMPGGLAFLAGARFLDLEETLGVRATSSLLGAGVTTTATDRIRTFNNFYGGQVGFRGDIGFGKYFVQATGKVAAGYMRQWVDLDGSTTFVTGGVTSTLPGGIFNAPEDLCRHHKDRFACVSEAGLNVGCQVLQCLRVHVGYTFLYTNSVLRPTSVTTPLLNPTSLPVSTSFGTSPARYVPRDAVADTEFHLHGLNVGFQFQF
ncbi:MAG TPA: BBP7 family outer membrane beta-barrel protein [Gemmataceae bacterium]|nr:BBP7 family outer membrane beta-barrel protein [Gemmataceae bacterium]